MRTKREVKGGKHKEQKQSEAEINNAVCFMLHIFFQKISVQIHTSSPLAEALCISERRLIAQQKKKKPLRSLTCDDIIFLTVLLKVSFIMYIKL